MSIETINQTNTIESEKTVEQILRENPELDESKYQEYLDIRLNSNQERQLLKQELDAEHLEEIKSNSLSEQNNISQGYERASEIVEEERRNSENNNENNIENFTSRLNEATQSAGQQVRERASEIKETVEKSEGISNVFSWLEQAKEKGGIMGFIAGIILGIASAFGYKKEVNEQIQEARENIENALEPEQITETKNTVKDTINDSLGDYMTDDNRERLNSAIDGLSEEKVRRLYHSIESGNFGIGDIEEIAPNLFKDILDEPQIEKIRDEIETTIIEKLSTSIKEEYGIDVELNQEKKAELENLVRDNLELSDERIMEIREIVEKKEFRYSDLSEVGGEVMFNSVNVMFGLISKGIVPMSNFTFNFVEASGKMIAIGAGALGISENISFENFQEKIEDMNESEKAMFVGMLYRKGGLFLSLVSNISEQVSRLAITSVTSTTVSSTSLLSASAMNNFSAQADNIDRIARTLDPSNLTDHKNILRAATDNLAKVRENYVMMDIIQGLEGDNAKKYGDLTRRLIEEKIEIPRHATDSFDDLLRVLGEKNNITSAASNRGSITSRIGFGANAELNRLNRKLETISNAQKRMFNPNFLTGGLSKLREAINIPEISRMGDRLSFHFDSPSQAKDALRRLNTLANRFPELLKGAIDKAPIIMVAGIAANSEEGVIESLKEQVLYLIPFVGPVMILMDSGWTWKDGIPKPIDPMNVGIGTVLLTIDGVIMGKEFVKGGIGMRGVGGYMIKPFMDVYSMGRGVADIGYSASRTVARGGVRSGLSQLGREAMRRVKNVPGGSRVRALALIGVVGYLGINQLLRDGEQIEGIEDLMTNGELNMDRINEAAGELTDGQKEDVINAKLEEDDLAEGLEVKVIADRVLIRSRNPNIKADWFINDSYNRLFEMLQINPDYEFEYVANA